MQLGLLLWLAGGAAYVGLTTVRIWRFCRVFQLAREAGFAGVCSAYGGYNVPGDDPFHLQRIHADPDIIRLKNWLTVDPRKLARVARFQYQMSQPPAQADASRS